MVISTSPVKSVGAVTVETKPGMTEKEKNNLEEELKIIKLRLQKTEIELEEEKKLTQSQVCQHDCNSWVACVLLHAGWSANIVLFVNLTKLVSSYSIIYSYVLLSVLIYIIQFYVKNNLFCL